MKQSLIACSLFLNALVAFAQIPCEEGLAGEYPCEGLDLLSAWPLDSLGGGANGNDCWGWVDPASDREFLLFGRSNGLSIVEVTDPVNPAFLAQVPTATVQSLWRDVKVFDNHAFVVSEAAGHGIQIIDLTQVLDVTDGPVQLTPVSQYLGFGNAHNIAMNESTGYAYGVGTNTAAGGLHAVDVSDPTTPMPAGTYEGAYTHDAQVVSYQGPDADHQGEELAFCFNGSAGVAIVNVTDKTDMQLVSSFTYAQSAYTHQGWLNEDHTMVYFNDELDEQGFGNGTRTYIADVSDLDNPFVVGYYEADNTAIDHNLYIRGDKVYASNYLSGLRISSIGEDGSLTPYAYFDTNPESDDVSFDGTWSNYPYFPSGTIAVTGFTHVFLLSDPLFEPETTQVIGVPQAPTFKAYPNPSRGSVRLEGVQGVRSLALIDLVGKERKTWGHLPNVEGLVLDLSGVEPGLHLLRATSLDGETHTVRLVIH